MWKRNLLFVSLIVVGFVALGGSLFPPASASRSERKAVVRIAPRDLAPAVARVDDTFRQIWTAKGIAPTPPAPELAVIRRLSLALTGTIPSLEEIRLIEAQPAGERVNWWLDRTLRDRRHADYLAERLARAFVGVEDGPFVFFRRRRFVTWLSDNILKNRPYDQTVRDLIADEGIWTDHPAVNFVTVTYDAEKKVFEAERLSARVARAFLGARIDCAQCHDHPFQPWKQNDFRGLTAFFGQVETGFSGVHDTKGEYKTTDRKTGKELVVAPKVPFLPELLPAEGRRRERLGKWVTSPKNPYFARATVNRVWAMLLGKPMVEPVDDLTSVPQLPPALQPLADDFIEHGYDLHRLIRVIVATKVFNEDSKSSSGQIESLEDSWAAFPITRLRPEQVAGGLIQAETLQTINAQSSLLTRVMTTTGRNEFVKRFGDTGEDEFDGRAGTIPQRLLMMNGKLVDEKTKNQFFNASQRIASQSPTDRKAVELSYLVVLTRRPTPEESEHFESRIAGTRGNDRIDRITDLVWTLLNASEFSWNH